jgi:hypothetical protein
VPLFFYLFDQLTEKLAERKKAKAEAKKIEGEKGPPDGGVIPKESGGGQT